MHYHWDGNTLFLNCMVQPRSREDSVAGLAGDAIKIRITAPPTDGRANHHLIKFLAKLFHVKRSAITIVSGQTSRRKRVCIANPATLPESIVSRQFTMRTNNEVP